MVNLVTFILLAFFCSSSFAHGGGLDSKGCHTNRKTGEYHCHRAQTAQRSQSPSANSLKSGEPKPFANCNEARAAGAAPVKRDDAGYGPHLDRDGDGIGCE